jgi:hypothetical protein
MSALNFKPQFAGPVESRVKRQSIRQKNNGHQVGRAIQLYTGMRTKACRKLVADDPVCVSIELVQIRAGHIIIAGRELGPLERKDMAQADGFANVFGFYAFFLGKGMEGDFSGFLIRWDWP